MGQPATQENVMARNVDPVMRDTGGNVIPNVVRGGPTRGNPVTIPPRPATAPPGPGAGGGGGSNPNPDAPGRPDMALYGGAGHDAARSIGQQTAQQNVTGQTPFMQTPGMQIASQRVQGTDIYNDPAVSASLQDFNNRVAPQIQNRSTLAGLGRSTAGLNSLALAQGQMLTPMYQDAMQREQSRLGNMNTAAENELGRRERSSARVADANTNMINQLMQLSQNQYNRQLGAGTNLIQAGSGFRDIAQQGNAAAQNDFLRRQALGEQAVYAPFGGLAQAGLGSTTSQSGK